MLIFLQFSIGTRAVVKSSRHQPFCFHNSCYQKYATRISECVIAVWKSQEFLLKVRRLSLFFSTTTPTPSSRRVVIFSMATQGIRLRRRVDVFSTTSDTNMICSSTMLTDFDFTLVHMTGSQLQPVVALLQCIICSCILSCLYIYSYLYFYKKHYIRTM